MRQSLLKGLFFGVLATAFPLKACPYDQVAAPTWNPLQSPAYVWKSFGDPLPSGTNMGVVFHEGVQINTLFLAPEQGKAYQFSESPWGKMLVFVGISGHTWRLGPLDSATNANLIGKEFHESQEIAKTSKDYFAIELWNNKGEALDPCEMGVACHDTIAPEITMAAVWDAANPNAIVELTSKADLANGCLRVPSQMRMAHVAFLYEDAATKAGNRLAPHYSILRHQTTVLHELLIQKIPKSHRNQFPAHLLETDSLLGMWFLAHGDDLTRVLLEIQRLPHKKAEQNKLRLEIMDGRLNTNTYNLSPRNRCNQPPPSIPSISSNPFLLWGELWIPQGICKLGGTVSILDSQNQILWKERCNKPWPTQLQKASPIRQKFPQGKTLIIADSSGNATAYKFPRQQVP